MTRALVIGADGFAGTNLCRMLAAAGALERRDEAECLVDIPCNPRASMSEPLKAA